MTINEGRWVLVAGSVFKLTGSVGITAGRGVSTRLSFHLDLCMVGW